MAAENNFNVKPLTNVPFVAPANPSGEQPARKQQQHKQRTTDPQADDLTPIDDDDGKDLRHVIDYQA
jgi:hypothetical protein